MASARPVAGAAAGRWDPQQGDAGDGDNDKMAGNASPMNLRRQPSEQK
jgi:hypothetical protein